MRERESLNPQQQILDEVFQNFLEVKFSQFPNEVFHADIKSGRDTNNLGMTLRWNYDEGTKTSLGLDYAIDTEGKTTFLVTSNLPDAQNGWIPVRQIPEYPLLVWQRLKEKGRDISTVPTFTKKDELEIALSLAAKRPDKRAEVYNHWEFIAA